MKTAITAGLLILVSAVGALAADRTPVNRLTQMVRGDGGVLYGQPQTSAAKTDTIYLLGGPGRLDGKFQDTAGQPDWHGWTSEDATFQSDAYWSVTDEPDLVLNGDRSLWCGVEYPEPGPIPVPGFGYGNGWRQNAVFTHTVADPGADSDVVWSLNLQHDTEPGYDYVHLQWNRGGQWTTLESFDGVSSGTLNLEYAFTVPADEHSGPAGDRIELRIRFTSDSAWSDEDGLWSTERGACQVDDVAVTVGGHLVSFTDFEDGQLGDWVQVPDPGVGDFAQLWTNLGDLDPCVSNWSPQVAFIDDGVVVPGTGGTMCITWCYGPGGYIVNNTGGLAGPGGGLEHKLNNLVKSPPLTWPGHADAGQLAFDVYRHEELGAQHEWPEIFYAWHVRSTATGDPDDLEHQPWRSHNFVYYGGPNYLRHQFDISSLLVPGVTHLQVSLRVLQLVVFHWVGEDGTPAPYFDNVAVKAYARPGPMITAREIDIAQDNFPTNPTLDFTNLQNNSVRFDMARNVAPIADGINYPGDTIIFDIVAVRAGSVLADLPKMHVSMKANPIYDGVRTLPPDFTQTGDVITGWVHGDTTRNAQGSVIANRYNFDLPDEGFFFPGDVIHYYIEAEDNLGGVSTLPGNLDSFGDFDHDLSFSSSFIVRALPTMLSATPGDQPKVLWWNDLASRGGENRWMFALKNLGYVEGLDYDLYYTNGPSSGVGNGLGGRATEFHLEHYDVLLYSSGNLSVSTLSNGDPNFDAGDDIGLVTAWLAGGKAAFFTGDDLVFSLLNAGSSGQALVQNYFGVDHVQRDLRPLIDNQTTPLVRAIPGNGVINRVDEWVANGGCPGINTFDAVNPGLATRLAEWTDPSGQGNAYTYAAATRYINPDNGAQVVYMPYDLLSLINAPGYTPPGGYAGIAARAIILGDILEDFGMSPQGGPLGVTPDAVFAVSNFPNPFNPTTTIKLSLPRTGDVSLKVFNVRGELVRTLVDGQLEAGSHEIIWDGTTSNGNQVASGVYFYETRTGSDVKVNKMALVK